MTDRRRLVLLLALAAAFWAWNPVRFISEDSYFYAVIARNLATRGVQSFWGTEPTNGVHPLWLYLLSGYDWIVARLSTSILHDPVFGVPLSATLLAIGAINFARVAARARLSTALLVFVPVAYLAFFGVLYSEVHAAWCAHSFLLRAVSDEYEDGRPRPAYVGFAAAAVLLSRLDSVFYVFAFAGWYMRRQRTTRTGLAMLGVLAAPALAYAASNLAWFGGVVPVSGYLKSTFPVATVRGFWRYPGSAMLMLSGYSVPFGWIPLATGALVAWRAKAQISGIRTVIYPLLAGTAGHAFYTGFFTGGFTFWYWYYLLPVLLMAWSLACATASWTPRFEAPAQSAVVLFMAAALVTWRFAAPSEQQLKGLITLRVMHDLGIDHSTLLVSEWPGTVAFHTNNEVIAADMLTSNRRLVDAVMNSRDAFATLDAEARRHARPIDFVVYNGGLFLVPDPAITSLEYHDPRMGRNLAGRTVGRLVPGAPMAERDRVTIWKVPPTGLAGSIR